MNCRAKMIASGESLVAEEGLKEVQAQEERLEIKMKSPLFERQKGNIL